jgi:fibronectin type 3 domain-containing protein
MRRVGTLAIVGLVVLASLLVLVDLASEKVRAQTWRTAAPDPFKISGWYPSIDTDSNNLPHIGYWKKDTSDLRYVTWNGTAFEITVIDSYGSVGQYTSIAVDSLDRPHLSYYNTTGAELKYAIWTGIEWIVQVVDTSGSVGSFGSIALDNNDRAHISYYDAGGADLKYAKWTGMGWQVEVVDSAGSVGRGTSIALDSNWRPHIAYNDQGSTSLKYAKWNGISWDIEIVDTAGDVGRDASLGLDQFDHAHIAYISGTDLKYAKWNGASWDLEILDVPPYVRETSIAVDHDGHPHITYDDDAAGWKRLKYATWDGSAWTKLNITYGGNFNVIAVDDGGYPHVAYYAWGSYLGYANCTPTVPLAPQNLLAIGGNNRIDLTWDAPANDGGHPITNYKIYRGASQGGETLLIELGDVQSYTNAGLTNGQKFFYKVSAVNSVGESALSDEVNATAMTVPTEPLNLVATASSSDVSLTWDPPSYDGGSEVTHYAVYRGTISGGESLLEEIGNSQQYTDSVVTIGVAYYYKVTASNAAGEGPFSEEVNAIPALPPTITLGLNAFPGDSVVNLTWIAPSYDGGSPVTNYTVYRGNTSGGQSLLTTVGNVQLYSDRDVVNDVTYYYKVGAVNSAGEGPLSNEASATPVNEPPTCSIVYPTLGAKLSGDVEVSGVASDTSGPVNSVEVKIDDGDWIPSSGTASWVYEWDTTTVKNGHHTIHVRSFDGSAYSNEATVTVKVQNQQEAEFGELWLWAVIVVVVILIVAGVALMLRRRSGIETEKGIASPDKEKKSKKR